METKNTDNTARSREAISAYLGHEVISGVDGSLYLSVPGRFRVFFADPPRVKAFLQLEFEDWVEGWDWATQVPVAVVSYRDSIDEALAFLFLDWSEPTPRVVVTYPDSFDGEISVSGLDQLALTIGARTTDDGFEGIVDDD